MTDYLHLLTVRFPWLQPLALAIAVLLVAWWLVDEGFTWSRKRRIRQRLNELHQHEQARVVRIAERAARRKAERGTDDAA